MPWDTWQRSDIPEVTVNRRLFQGRLDSNLFSMPGAGDRARYMLLPGTCNAPLPSTATGGFRPNVDGLVFDRRDRTVRALEMKATNAAGYKGVAILAQALAAAYLLQSGVGAKQWVEGYLRAAAAHLQPTDADRLLLDAFLISPTPVGALLLDGWNDAVMYAVRALQNFGVGSAPFAPVRYAYYACWSRGRDVVLSGFEGIDTYSGSPPAALEARIKAASGVLPFGQHAGPSLGYCSGDGAYYVGDLHDPVAYAITTRDRLLATRPFRFAARDLAVWTA